MTVHVARVLARPVSDITLMRFEGRTPLAVTDCTAVLPKLKQSVLEGEKESDRFVQTVAPESL